MKRIVWWIVVGCAVGLVAIIVVLRMLPKSAISPSIKDQVTSTILLPSDSITQLHRDSVKYDASSKLLTYTVSYKNSTIIVSEQPTPDSFVDVPKVYEKVLESMYSYASFATEVGSVHLTTPKELAGKQAAVLNTKGTLLFAKTDHNLSQDEWRLFFKDFNVVK